MQGGADLVSGGGVVWDLGGVGEALDETFEDGQGERDDGRLAGADAEDGGEDVQDAGVQVGLDDGGEDFGGVDEGVEGEGDEGGGFVGRLRARERLRVG